MSFLQRIKLRVTPIKQAKPSPSVAGPLSSSSTTRSLTTTPALQSKMSSSLSTAPGQDKSLSESTKQLLEAIHVRRSTYTLSQESTISDAAIREILETALEQVPSTFGSFTTRLVLVLKDEHIRLWDAITEIVKSVTPPDKWEEHTLPRLQGFRNSYGTVLFFEDPENTKILQEQFAFAKDKFPVWAQHTSAMHQLIIWTALTNSGLGANLQHYNPLIDAKIQDMFDVPKTWDLVAQLTFGKPTAPAGPKPDKMKKPLDQRLFVHGA